MSLNRILYITKGEHSASTRYRATDFFEDWRNAGWVPSHITHDGSLRTWFEIFKQAKQSDVVVVVRRIFNSPFRQCLRRCAKRLVYDYDDAIFVRGSGEKSASKWKRYARNMSNYDLIWAGNPYLAEKASAFNSCVEVVPTAIEPERYDLTPEKSGTYFDLVWIGSRSTRKHLITVLPALEAAAVQIPRLRLKVIADFELDSEQLKIVNIPWSPEVETLELTNAHVGIAPLPENAFNRGKCGLKILQYMASRLPVICTPTGVNADLVVPGETGFHACSPEEWVSSIQRLAADLEMGGRMGVLGQQRCTMAYTRQAVFEKRLQSLKALVEG